MNDTITKIVNLLFENVQENEETLAMREEILNNCQEHYRDLVGGGVEPETATAAIVESLKGMEEVLAQYPQKDEANMPADEQAFREAGFDAVAQTACETQNVEDEYVFPAWDVKEISLSLVNDDLNIGVSDDGKVHVHCDAGAQALSVRHGDGRLYIERSKETEEPGEERSGNFHMEVDADNIGDFFRKVFSEFSLKKLFNGISNLTHLNDSVEVTLLLPAESNIAVSCTGTGGDLHAEEVRFGDLRMTSTSGDVSLTDVQLGSFTMTTTSGDVEMDDVELTGDLTLQTTSGDVEFEGRCRNMRIMTVSGDVEVNALMETAEVKTVSGDVDVTAEEEGIRSFSAKSTSGDLSLKLPENTTAQVNYSTVSGSVQQNRVGYSGVAQVDVHMQTVSGDISVY